MSFLGMRKSIHPMRTPASPASPSHRSDEFPAGYSLAGLRSRIGRLRFTNRFEYAVKSSCRSIVFHRTVNSVLTVGLTPGGRSNFTQLLGINDTGTIVGYHGAAVNKGFTLTLPSTFTDTNFPGSAQTQVTGVPAPQETTIKSAFMWTRPGRRTASSASPDCQQEQARSLRWISPVRPLTRCSASAV